MQHLTKYLASGALALTLSFGGASAATITWSDASTPAGNLAPTSTVPSVLIDQTASVGGLTKSPFEGTALYGTAFNSVGANASATYVFSSLRSALKLVWGSVDTYNYIDFYNGAALLGTFNGVDAGPVFGNNRALTEMLATIGGFGMFDSVTLRSPGSNAFEHAGVAAVPVPAAGFLLFGALGGLAALRRRRKAA